MGDGFTVDMDALTSAAAGIVGVLKELDAHQVKDIDCDKSAFGHHKLAHTTKDFCDRWQKGVTNLAKDGQHVAKNLVDTVNDYAEMETNAVASFHTIGGGDDPPGAGGPATRPGGQ